MNQATRYASQHKSVSVPSQDKLGGLRQEGYLVFAGDMNGHVGSSNAGYEGTHGGFGYGSRNADGSRILEFPDGLNLVICNTLFTKQEAKLVTYVAGPVKSTVDYIMVRQEDKAKIRNVKVITSEECVPKHKLLVMDMRFKATKRRRRKFEPRVRVWTVSYTHLTLPTIYSV